jgi:hypothetical protein
LAITAAITLSSSTVKSEQLVTATCTVTNTGATAVNVTAVAPSIVPTGQTPQSVAAMAGMPAVGGAFPTQVPGSSGTLAISWPVVCHAPVTSYNSTAEPSSVQYDIGGIVYTSDGSATAATVATLTVNYPSN